MSYPYDEGDVKDVFHRSRERMWVDHKVKEGHRSVGYRQRRRDSLARGVAAAHH